MKKLLLCVTLIFSVWACSDNNSVGPEPEPEPENPENIFSEGQIDIDIAMPGHPGLEVFVDVYNQIDPETGYSEEQMQEIISNLPAEDQAALQEFQNSFGDISDPSDIALFLSLLYLPVLENVIYLRENEATAKFDALTYHGENQYNLSTKSGEMYMRSRWSAENQVSFTYTEESLFDGFAQVFIDDEFYDIEQTDDTENVAGLSATKSIYIIKDVNNTSAGPYRLDVWTSAEMSAAVNYSHPFYLQEEGGIVKLAIYYSEDSEHPVIYEFKNITSREISDAELNIEQTQPVYNYEDDMETISMEILGILFGGSTQAKMDAMQAL